MIGSPPIAIACMESCYARSVIHATYVWVLKILGMGIFIGCGYGSKARIDGSTLVGSRMLWTSS
jgi:hypothetical protein